MTDYTWPADLYPSSYNLKWEDNSARFKSIFSGVTRTVNRPGGRWRMSMQFTNLTPAKGQKLEAFIWRLDGATHRAIIPDFSYALQGTGGLQQSPIAVGRVDGAGQIGRTLMTDGWTAGELIFKAGDRVNVGDQMLVVAEDCYVSGGSDIYLRDEDGNILYDESSPQQPILIESGNAQIFFTSILRSSPADNTVIGVQNPTAKYILADQFESSAVVGVFKNYTVEFEEAV